MRPGGITGNATLEAHVRRRAAGPSGAAMPIIPAWRGALGRMRVRQ
jgi:hypothetical protein